MDDYDLALSNAALPAQLENRGHVLGEVAVRSDGCMLIEVDRVFMFARDVVDVATGRVTVATVQHRNRAQVFPRSPYS